MALSENPVLGFVDFGGERGGPASIGMHLLHQPAVRLANFRLAGAGLKPQNLIGFLRIHAARAKRRTLPVCLVSLEVVSPTGMRAVKVSFQEP